jgi:adenylate cyclase
MFDLFGVFLEKKGLSGKKWENVVNLYQKIGKRVFTHQNRVKKHGKNIKLCKNTATFFSQNFGHCSAMFHLEHFTNGYKHV